MKGIMITGDYSQFMREFEMAKTLFSSQGLDVDFVDYNDIEVTAMDTFDGRVRIRGEMVECPDFVFIMTTEERETYQLKAVLRMFETLGVVCVNTYDAVEKAGDKLYSFQIAKQAVPGIRIPEPFDGYSAVFGKSDMSIGVFSDSLLWKGSEKPYKAEDGTIALTHELFRNDALILSGYGGAMAISDKDGNDFVRVISPDFPILGLWQPSSGEAPFVCVEPWSSYPGSDGLTDISRRSDFISIEAGREKMMALRIEFPGA